PASTFTARPGRSAPPAQLRCASRFIAARLVGGKTTRASWPTSSRRFPTPLFSAADPGRDPKETPLRRRPHVTRQPARSIDRGRDRLSRWYLPGRATRLWHTHACII